VHKKTLKEKGNKHSRAAQRAGALFGATARSVRAKN
jgi:hypothetical protein